MVKRFCAHTFLFTIVLILPVILGTLIFSWAQTPQHLQSFKISALQKGEFLLLLKKPDEALKVFKKLWQKEPQNGFAVRGIVRCYRAIDNLQEAVSLLRDYSKKHPQSSSSAYGLGYALFLQGKYEESRGSLNRSIRLDPENALALNNLSAVLVEFKEYENAIKRVKEAIEIAPKQEMFYRNLKMIYSSSGLPDQFEKDYQHFLANKNLVRAKGYGLILAQKLRQKSFRLYADGKIDESIEAITGMLEFYRELNHESGIVAGLFSLAVLYEEQGKEKLSLEKYREVLKINPQHIQAREKMRSLGQKKD